MLRGLDIRVEYALAKVLEVTDPEAALEVIGLSVVPAAEYLGGREYYEGIDIERHPLTFQGVSELEEAWRWGWERECDWEQMQACEYCQDQSTGNPCPLHG